MLRRLFCFGNQLLTPISQLLAFLWLEHVAATIWRSTMADRFLFDFFCARDVDDQAIIVKEFFARADVPQGLDENAAAAVFDRGAVWIAGMIDPACFVSTDRGIDHFFFVVESEIIGAQVIQVLGNIRP